MRLSHIWWYVNDPNLRPCQRAGGRAEPGTLEMILLKSLGESGLDELGGEPAEWDSIRFPIVPYVSDWNMS